MLINTSLSYRHIFNSSKDHVIISADYASQENRVAAFLSRDEVMLKAFNSPEQLTKEFTITETLNDITTKLVKSITYNNPDTDLHTQTAMQTYIDVFKDVPDYKIIEVASNTVRDGIIIRKAGKVTNFSLNKMGPLLSN